VFGVCGALNLPGRPSAQKTGTSEPFEGTQARTLIGDTWAVGYTPQIVAGTWFGNANNKPMVNILSTSVSWRTWQDFMVKAHEHYQLPPEQFTRPPTIVEREVCYPSGKLPTDACPAARRYKALFAAEQLEGPKPIALFDDWWQRSGGGVRLVLPPEWRAATPYLARLGIAATCIPAPGARPGDPGACPTAVPAATPPPQQPNPQQPNLPPANRGGSSVALTTPSSGSVVRGSVSVSGVAATPDLRQVVVEYSSGNRWIAIGSVNGSSLNGVSTTWLTWNTAELRPGAYAIRVTAVDGGGANASAIASVTVQRD
jgi:membrane peptidoglycan carboxypeptidase